MIKRGTQKVNDVKILVVEDEDFVRESLIDYLDMKGYENTLSATKGEEAIQIIEKENLNFVLLDIQLADETDGMKVLKRAREISPDSKIIMMSAYYREYGQEAKKLGAYAFIKKPIRQETLTELEEKLEGK